jgi:hypothetical protein
MSLFMDVDTIIGTDFEKGLANLANLQGVVKKGG